jgi:hypothetical protein
MPALGECYVVDAPIDFGEHIIPHFAVVFAAIFRNPFMTVFERGKYPTKINAMLGKIDFVFSVVPIEFHKSIMGLV